MLDGYHRVYFIMMNLGCSDSVSVIHVGIILPRGEQLRRYSAILLEDRPMTCYRAGGEDVLLLLLSCVDMGQAMNPTEDVDHLLIDDWQLTGTHPAVTEKTSADIGQ